MKKILGLLFLSGFLAACTDASFSPIDSSTDFVASLNTLEPSIDFISKEHEIFETWDFKKPYTGFNLVSEDYVFLYGYLLEEAELFQLSTGKKIASFPVNEGTTYAYAIEKTIYVTNGKDNTVISYDIEGNVIAKAVAGKYPMSMITDKKYLYVINFKDTILSVYSIQDLKLVTTWEIPTLSHGLYINGNELWIGGHGAGSQANKVIRRYLLQNGELQGEIVAPMMPIDFTDTDNGNVFAVSHGNNYVYELTKKGELMNSIKVGANPFTIVSFNGYVVVAGYDDHQAYFIQNGEIVDKVQVGKGPFQLITREVQ